MERKIVVTGGSGFIGSHVVDALADAGHRVRVLDHGVRPHRDDVEFADVDLLDLPSVMTATQDADQIFHLAAVSNVNHAFENPVYGTALNVMGTTHVLEAARQNGAKRVHLASTVWVYNAAAEGIAANEEVPFQLNAAGHIYTATKMACEMLCHSYHELYNLPFTILRYGIPYGPRMREELLIPIFLKKALAGDPMTVAGAGKQFRKFLYVTDMAAAHVLAMGEEAAGQTYNLEGSEPITVLEVAESIQKLVGPGAKIEFTPERPGDFAGKEVTSDKARRELSWKPSVDFESGMAASVQWFCEKWGVSLPDLKEPGDSA